MGTVSLPDAKRKEKGPKNRSSLVQALINARKYPKHFISMYRKTGQPMVDRFAGMAFPKNVYLCCPQSGNHVILESHRFIQNFPFGIIRSGDLVTEGTL